MKTVGLHAQQLLYWHKRYHLHPIFDPTYARENLVSLIETFVMLFCYIAALTVFLHLTVLEGLFKEDTISWLIIETNARNLMFWASGDKFLNNTYVTISIFVFFFAVLFIRRVFNIAKARLHPGSKRKSTYYFSKQFATPQANQKMVLKSTPHETIDIL